LGHADLSVNVAAGPANHAKTRTASFTIVAATAGISFPVGFGVDSAVVNTPPDKNPTGKELSGLYFRGAGIGGAFFVSAGVGTVRLGRGHGYLYSNPFGGNPFKGYAIHHVPNWLNFRHASLRQCHALAIVGGGGTIAEKENLLCQDHYVRRFFDLRKLQFYTVRKDASAGLTLVAWIRSLGLTIPTERNGFDSGLKS
jgi:hypothetical protein